MCNSENSFDNIVDDIVYLDTNNNSCDDIIDIIDDYVNNNVYEDNYSYEVD